MKKIVGYFPGKDTWRLTDEKSYRKVFTHDIAISYLKQEILESVEREIDQVIKSSSAGFYAALRFLFAEVTYLAHLYWGSAWRDVESRCVARYMRKFKILAPTSGLHYEVFRHGLQHTHHPKWLEKGRKVVPWYISNVAKLDSFGICIPEFKIEVESAVNEFIRELEIEKSQGKSTRLHKFFEGLVDAAEVITKKDLTKYARTDYSKLKLP